MAVPTISEALIHPAKECDQSPEAGHSRIAPTDNRCPIRPQHRRSSAANYLAPTIIEQPDCSHLLAAPYAEVARIHSRSKRAMSALFFSNIIRCPLP